MEVEITTISPLTAEQCALVQAHSLWNGYNMLREELTILGRHLADNPALLTVGIQSCEERIARLRDPRVALVDATRLDELDITVDAELESHLQRSPRLARAPTVIESKENLRSLSWILRVRARELLARASANGNTPWSTFTVAELEADFQEFLRALEQNAHGRYRIVSNLALQQSTDYHVDLKFESARGTSVFMPAVFKDVIRDLIANARKYTPPGGQIHAAIHSGPDGFRGVVSDTGRGIPANEIPAVVEGGRRGRNVADHRTMGGGYGLTKAFLATKQFNGRFWIDSEEGHGTKVRIWLPAPTSSPASGFAL
ncbi:MAG: ATP-binding protein [Opitutaceae bacterium]|nr:ATP-binding protein [Opitutaceae bacterium]